MQNLQNFDLGINWNRNILWLLCLLLFICCALFADHTIRQLMHTLHNDSSAERLVKSYLV